MLLNICNHNYTHFMRRILYLAYFCTSRPRSMSYLCDLFFIFRLTFIFINHITLLKQTYLLFVHLLEYFLLFWDDNTLRMLLSSCLIFCQFQPGVTYKSLAYKKAYNLISYKVLAQYLETTESKMFAARIF